MTDSELTSKKAANNDTVNNKNGSRPTGLEKVTAAVLAAAHVRPGDLVIDLARLERAARDRSLSGIEVLARPIDCLALPACSADLIVTSYALHRLRDADKQRLVFAAYHWLKPGGTFVVADMMFGRGTTSRDRAIIKSKVRVLARRGLGGWWRIAKNGCRYLVRVREHPVSISAWTAMFAGAGFTGITASSIVNEAGLVSGHRPAEPAEPGG